MNQGLTRQSSPQPARLERPVGDAPSPSMLDGMEVLFDKTVGLYPVELDGGGVSAAAPNAARTDGAGRIPVA